MRTNSPNLMFAKLSCYTVAIIGHMINPTFTFKLLDDLHAAVAVECSGL